MNSKQAMPRDIVVVGGSAGSIESLRSVLEQLPENFGAAIFVTIHIPSDFPSLLPSVLSSGPLPAKHPEDGELIKTGTVYAAPADYHLLIERGQIHLSRGARENRHRPAIDPMFRSAARSYGARVAGVILSGQLDDGSAGLMAVKMRGGLAIVQNPHEALSPPMPQNAINYAHPDYVLNTGEIAQLLIKIVNEPQEVEIRKLEIPVSDELEDETQEADLQDAKHKKRHGKPSPFSCPECHGVLWELEDGELLRFRCRVGHAYTSEALGVALSESAEDALWASMRVMEEKASLLRRMAARIGPNLGKKYLEEASDYDKHVETIRTILVDNQQLHEKKKPKEDAA